MNKNLKKTVAIFLLSIVTSLPANAAIIINEIMQNPSAVADSAGEWFELFNSSATDIDINGWTIKDDDFDIHVIDNGGPLTIMAGGFLVIGVNDDFNSNGGITLDYTYGRGPLFLSNGADELILQDVFENEVDRVEWDGGPTFPDPIGASMALTTYSADNNVASNWAQSTALLPSGDFATPGLCNTDVKQNCTVTTTNVSAPQSVAIFAVALLGLALCRRKR